MSRLIWVYTVCRFKRNFFLICICKFCRLLFGNFRVSKFITFLHSKFQHIIIRMSQISMSTICLVVSMYLYTFPSFFFFFFLLCFLFFCFFKATLFVILEGVPLKRRETNNMGAVGDLFPVIVFPFILNASISSSIIQIKALEDWAS